MKKLIKTLPFVFLLVLFFGCTKDDSSSLTTSPSTSLKIIVNDDSGNPVSQALVKLYLSQTDLVNNTNQVLTTQTTNSNGEVIFSPVSDILTYYWLAKKDCKTNIFDNSISNSILLFSNTVNTFSTTISDKGKLKFTNNSINPYNVYVNNVLKISNMPGGTTNSYFYSPGNYSIRVEQQSGYIFNPTIQTYSGTLNCGGTLTTTFPN